MTESKILALSNNYEKTREYGDKFFGTGIIKTDQDELNDNYYVWKYNQGAQNQEFWLYVDKEEKQYGYSNKDYSVDISYANTNGLVIFLDLADNMAFKYLIDNLEKIWKELDIFIPIVVLSFWDKERLKKSKDNYIYVPNPTYGGSMEHICKLVCRDLEEKVSEKGYKINYNPLSRNNPILSVGFIKYLFSTI